MTQTIEEEVAYLAFHRLFYALTSAKDACKGLARGIREKDRKKFKAWKEKIFEINEEVFREMNNLAREEFDP